MCGKPWLSIWKWSAGKHLIMAAASLTARRDPILRWRFWAGRRDRLAFALTGVMVLAGGLSVISQLTDSVRGTVARAHEQTWRASYNILVHVPLPDGATLPDVTEPNVLTTLPRGITLAQWEAVRQVADVTIAAPVAMVGVFRTGPTCAIPSKEIPRPPDGLYRVRETVRSANPLVPQIMENQSLWGFSIGKQRDPSWPADLMVVGGRPSEPLSRFLNNSKVPVLLAGIDPESEAALMGLDQAVTEGRYLTRKDALGWTPIMTSPGSFDELGRRPTIPVMVNLRPFRDMEYTLALAELNPDGSIKQVVYERHWGSAELAQAMTLGETHDLDGRPFPASHGLQGRSGPVRLTPTASPFPDRWPLAVTIEPQTADLEEPLRFMNDVHESVKVDLGPTYRQLHPLKSETTADKQIRNVISYKVVGFFDSARLNTEKDPETNMPLMTYRPAEALRVLDADGKPLNPPQTISGGISPVSFLSSPPAFLTTIEGAVAVAGDGAISGLDRTGAGGDGPVTPSDPMPWMVSCSRPSPPVRTQYQLDIRLDPADMGLTGRQQVRFTNNEQVALDSLYSHLFTNAPFFAQGTRRGRLTIQEVRVNGQAVAFSGGTDEILGLQLPSPLLPGAAVTVELVWEAQLPDMVTRYGVEDSTLSLGNFYPILAVHDAGGWHLDRYVHAGDPFNSDVADYEVAFAVPDGYQVAATGRQVEPGRFSATMVRDFAAAASADWQLYEQMVDGVRIHYYWDPKTALVAPEVGLATAVGAVRFFSEQFGPYPYGDLTVVSHLGMEYPLFVLVTTLSVIVHEIAHQWWYGTVGNDEVRQIWDEGLTEFATLYYLSTVGQPRGRVISPADAALDDVLYRYASLADRPGPYALTIYGRGWRLWEALRSTVGDDPFFRMVQDFYRHHQFGIATWEDWRKAVSQAGGPEALRVFDEYVYLAQLPAELPDVVAPYGKGP